MNMTCKKPISVAIDGPSGAGKSTIAKSLAGELDFMYVDTGALYRAVGYSALQSGINISDVNAVTDFLPSLQVELKYLEGSQHVFVNGQDVNDHIRTPEVSMAASKVSSIPAVRAFLFHLQQDTAKTNSIIMDGRDIGTVVLPHADVKIFLTASAEARAQRRYKELCEKGQTVTLEEVLEDMRKRDYDDSHRAAAPLKAADDAVMVDTTEKTLDESIQMLKQIVLKKIAL